MPVSIINNDGSITEINDLMIFCCQLLFYTSKLFNFFGCQLYRWHLYILSILDSIKSSVQLSLLTLSNYRKPYDGTLLWSPIPSSVRVHMVRAQEHVPDVRQTHALGWNMMVCNWWFRWWRHAGYHIRIYVPNPLSRSYTFYY